MAGSAAALRATLGARWEWLWLLDDSVAPEPPALERLLEALGSVESLPEPVLLASKVVGPDGSLDPSALPVVEVFKADVALAALDRRLLALRVARRGSLLVHRRAVERWGVPGVSSRPGAEIAWTARLLKHEPGLLVPGSVAVRLPSRTPAKAGRAFGELAGWVRLAAGDALEPRERPWFAFRAAEAAFAALCRRRP